MDAAVLIPVYDMLVKEYTDAIAAMSAKKVLLLTFFPHITV